MVDPHVSLLQTERLQVNGQTAHPPVFFRVRRTRLRREEMLDLLLWNGTFPTRHERRSNIPLLRRRRPSPGRSMRSRLRIPAPAPKGRDEMHFAVLTHALHEPQDGHLAVDGHSDVGFEVAVLH